MGWRGRVAPGAAFVAADQRLSSRRWYTVRDTPSATTRLKSFSFMKRARNAALAEASVIEQQRIEAADSMLFEQYRLAYWSPERLYA